MTRRSSCMLVRSSMAALIFAAASISAALAQEAGATAAKTPQSSSSSGSQTQEIIVTGSRLGRTAFDSPTPVNVIDDRRMKTLAIPDIADALNQLPAFRAVTTPASDLFRVSGAIAANSVDLRGLGPTRTLVLVDGRRFVPSTDGGTVDLNGIPSALVQRAEVVTGGASAAYGADAVAGVVNLILDTKFTGFKTDVNGGISGHGDDGNYFLSAAGGDDFANGRGHFIIGAEYQNDDGVGRCQTRDFCAKFTNFVANPGYIGGVSTNGLPATLVLNNVLFVENPTGILVSAVKTVGSVKTTLGQQVNNTGANRLPAGLQGLQFSADGESLAPFQFGNFLSGLFMQGGDPSVAGNVFGWGDEPLVTPTSHVSTLGHVDYEITDSIQAFGEFMFSHVDGGPVRGSVVTETPVGGTVGLSINNPFITPAVRAQILAADPNITAINVNVAKTETGAQAVSNSANDIWRAVVGLKGRVFENWNWDVSYEHGETSSRTDVHDTRLAPFDAQAANAITPPGGYTGPIYTTPAGAPVICASSVANPADGCIPVNFLGANSVSAAALTKYFQSEWQTRTIKQDDVAANLRGSLFDIWAGPVKGAIGGEWREDSAEGATDPLTLAGAFTAPQTTALPLVRREVEEAYVETSVPLLTNLPFAKSLTTDLAGRYTHYSSSGDAKTWKAGLEYEPDDQILFRFTKSADIRAPTAAESNPNAITTLFPLNDPFSGGTHSVSVIAGGNPNLNLEHADTKTAGVVLKPNFIPGFKVSFDFYDIKVKGAIDTLSAPTILSACFQQNLLCNLIVFSGAAKASPASIVFTNFQNLSRVHAQGDEVVAEYTIDDVLGGSLDFEFNANYIMQLKSIGATGLITRLDGVTGNAGSLTAILGVPEYKLDGVVTYSRPVWSVTAHARFIPESILDPTKVGPTQPGYNINLPNSVSINTVSKRFYLDLSGTLRPTMTMLGGGKIEIYGAVNNIFDTEEPPQLRLFGNPLQYDVIGRAFRLGLRTHW